MSVTSVLSHRPPRTAPPASPSPPQPRRPRLRSRLAAVSSATLVGFCLSVLVLAGGSGLTDVDSAATPAVGAITARATPAEARLMRRYDCSTSGLPEGAIPGSALVREPDGRVHAVSFDRGWRIYRRHGPRTLVAVCLRPLR